MTDAPKVAGLEALHPDAFLLDPRDLNPEADEPRSSGNQPTSTDSRDSNELLRAFTKAGVPPFVEAVRA
jgi:hypothetical protein